MLNTTRIAATRFEDSAKKISMRVVYQMKDKEIVETLFDGDKGSWHDAASDKPVVPGKHVLPGSPLAITSWDNAAGREVGL
jgi:Fungal fucose-specific lectin